MNNIRGNYFSTPTKPKSVSFHGSLKDFTKTNICRNYSHDLLNENQRNCIIINTSSEEPDTFSSNDKCVTSTPLGRGVTLVLRKSSTFKPKRYSLRSEHDARRVDITDQVKVLKENINNIEKTSNDIYMIYLKCKYSRINTMYSDLNANESNIYLYPALFNSNIMSSKFVSRTQLSNGCLVNHRYDNDRYILKTGEHSNTNFLSLSNQKIIREICILKFIGNHPHIIEYCDSWLEEEMIHLQLKHISGESLHDFILFRNQSIEDNTEIFFSKTAAIILLAHIGSVLAYLHDILCLSHGTIDTKHIIVEFLDNADRSDRFSCYKALIDDETKNDLRFKLCDFDTCEAVYCSYHTDANTAYNEDRRDKDIFLFGRTIFDCLCGSNQNSDYELQHAFDIGLSSKVSDQLIFIIMNMCHQDPKSRWTTRNILSLDEIDQYILPEARDYLPDYTNITNDCRYLIHEPPVKFIAPFNFEKYSQLSVSSTGNYCIMSDYSNQMVDITDHVQSITKSRQENERCLRDIHDKYIKFKEFSFSKGFTQSDNLEKCIFDYPVLFNSEVTNSKFSSQILISETKLSMIYIVDHRFDGDSYILKVGLESLTFAISDSSREIINEMKILKLIGKHPNVVGYCDCWIEQEKFHLQLKFVPGGSLYDFTQGHISPFKALSDTKKRTQKCFISSQSAFVLLAHMSSVLVYIHEELRIFHGDIKPSNILVELAGQHFDSDMMNNAKLYCQNILSSEQLNMNLRFKLCDFGRSGPTANILSMEEGDGRYLPNLSEIITNSDCHSRAISRDIFSLGLSIYDCFGGVIDQDSARDIRGGKWPAWPSRITDEWRDIIMHLSHIDPLDRWTARQPLSLDKVQTFILPEAKYHLRGQGRCNKSATDDGSFSSMATEILNYSALQSPVNVSRDRCEEMDCSF